MMLLLLIITRSTRTAETEKKTPKSTLTHTHTHTVAHCRVAFEMQISVCKANFVRISRAHKSQIKMHTYLLDLSREVAAGAWRGVAWPSGRLFTSTSCNFLLSLLMYFFRLLLLMLYVCVACCFFFAFLYFFWGIFVFVYANLFEVA